MKYQMRQKIAAIGDDSWIEDEHGTKVYKVNGKAMRMRDTFVLEDPAAPRSRRSRSARCTCATRWRSSATARRSPRCTSGSSGSATA